MEVSISGQLYVFLAMSVCGVCSGLIFDIFRAIRKTFSGSNLTTSLSDILFWLIISLGMFFALFTISGGEIRWHEIIGVILGSVIYFLTISHLFVTLLVILIHFTSKIFLTILKIILTPLVFLYKMIKRPLYWGFVKLKYKTHRFSLLFIWVKNSFKRLRLVMKKS